VPRTKKKAEEVLVDVELADVETEEVKPAQTGGTNTDSGGLRWMR